MSRNRRQRTLIGAAATTADTALLVCDLAERLLIAYEQRLDVTPADITNGKLTIATVRTTTLRLRRELREVL